MLTEWWNVLDKVTAHWFDSACYTATAVFERGERVQLKLMETSGYLFYEDKELIAIAKDYDKENDTFRGVSTIPKVNITKITRR